MSWIERALFITIIIYLFVLIVNPFRKKIILNYLPVIAFGFLICHVMFDTVRWQLYPVYFVVSMTFMVSLVSISMAKSKTHVKVPDNRKKLGVVVIVALLLSGGFIFSFPLYEIPEPSGNYEIGTAIFELSDDSRTELYGELDNENRRMKVQIWYPAEAVEGNEQVPWLEEGRVIARAVAKEMKVPFFVLDHTKDILSHAYKNVEMNNTQDKYPVIVLSHGWTGFNTIHTDLAELLASNGYIVVGINHTYGAQVTVFEDGTEAFLDRDALPNREITPDFLTFANQLVMTYASDVTYVLDRLSDFNTGFYDDTFTGRLDLDRIGLLGHSTGGGADVAVALDDSRIKALLGMDAWVEPIKSKEISKGLKMPALFLRSEQWEEGLNNANLLTLIENSTNDISLYQIDGTTHLDFTMAYMYSRLAKYIHYTGDLDRPIFADIQNAFILDFFNLSIKGNTRIDMNRIVETWPMVKQIK